VAGPDGYWTYAEWLEATVRKIVAVGLSAPEKDRADWFDLQIRLAIGQALRHGRTGLGDDDPVAP
jgi:hypothetical protein